MDASERARLLATLLRGKEPDAFTQAQLRSKAHWRWDREQHLEAFLLFDAAARRAEATGDRTGVATARNRAAVTLFRAGVDRDEALARLRAVLDHYRAAPHDEEDRHFVDWAWTCLLETSAPVDFAADYRAGVDDCRALGWPDFPHVTPHIERLAELAFAAGARDLTAALVEKRRGRKPVPQKLRARLDELARWARGG